MDTLPPHPPVAETRLRSPGVSPPIVLPEEATPIPWHPLERKSVPVGSVPMKLPLAVFPFPLSLSAALRPPGRG